jgi:hypothetical protein
MEMTMNRVSATSSHTLPWLVGRNIDGEWVVRDQTGLHGGIFVDRAEAIRFAMFETGQRPQAVVMVAGILELDPDSRIGHAA